MMGKFSLNHVLMLNYKSTIANSFYYFKFDQALKDNVGKRVLWRFIFYVGEFMKAFCLFSSCLFSSQLYSSILFRDFIVSPVMYL